MRPASPAYVYSFLQTKPYAQLHQHAPHSTLAISSMDLRSPTMESHQEPPLRRTLVVTLHVLNASASFAFYTPPKTACASPSFARKLKTSNHGNQGQSQVNANSTSNKNDIAYDRLGSTDQCDTTTMLHDEYSGFACDPLGKMRA